MDVINHTARRKLATLAVLELADVRPTVCLFRSNVHTGGTMLALFCPYRRRKWESKEFQFLLLMKESLGRFDPTLIASRTTLRA